MNAAIILAAGSSSRFGKPKQNLRYHDMTLLQKIITTALGAHCHPVIIVLGANSEQIEPTVQDRAIHIVHNQNWADGMSSSIKAGIMELSKFPGVANAFILLCDQPFVDLRLLCNIIAKKNETGRSIIACAYGQTMGVPVLFDKIMFSKLFSLKSNEGAKSILKKYANEIASVHFTKGIIDIDTPEDYDSLLSQFPQYD